MDEKRRATRHLFLKSSLYAFVFPVGFMLVFGAPSLSALLIAGVFSAATAGPAMAMIFGDVVPATKRIPFVPAILLQALSFFGVGGLMFALNVLVVSAAINNAPLWDPVVLRNATAFMKSDTVRIIFWSGAVLFVVIAMIEQVRRKLGPGVISNWVTGKYHRPREEERVFMFLDLKDSTPLAERLGNLAFSALVQEFFNDLGWAVLATRATVSHYIGDEAVIVWSPDKAIRDANCLRIFFKMREEIEKRADEYRDRFGLVPSFKAGVHLGPVVAAEVGRTKSEIVYHGDVVNTTARIVGMCSALERDLLVSKDVADRLGVSRFALEPMGSHVLKGKAEPVELFAVAHK